MSRLPNPGSDEGTWGTVLNDFLSVAHSSDGNIAANAITASSIQDGSITSAKLQDGSVTTAKLQDSAVTNVKIQNNAVDANKIADGSVGRTKLNTSNTASASQVLSYNGTNLTWVAPAAGAVTSVNSQTGAVVLDAGDVGAESAAITLRWSGTDYTPTGLKGDTSRPKVFVGPTDPDGFSGVVLSTYDEWDMTSS